MFEEYKNMLQRKDETPKTPKSYKNTLKYFKTTKTKPKK
jgi:hypothetical protein